MHDGDVSHALGRGLIVNGRIIAVGSPCVRDRPDPYLAGQRQPRLRGEFRATRRDENG